MKRVLVATDFSTRSDRALRRAILLAGQCGASLTLVHVIDDDQPAYLIESQRDAASDLLQETARTMSRVDHVAADVVIATGEASAGILRVAEEVDAELVIVGPRRRQFLDTFVGTTAERTIRRSRRPILMANATPAGHYGRSLIAVDFDDASRATVEAVQRLCILEGADVAALHLFDAPAIGMMRRSMETPEAIDHYTRHEEGRARTKFAAFFPSALQAVFSQQIFTPNRGSTAGLILSCADQHDADLIVVGTNQKKGLERFLLGSVAQKVLLDAKRDVLVIPATKGSEAAKPRSSPPEGE